MSQSSQILECTHGLMWQTCQHCFSKSEKEIKEEMKKMHDRNKPFVYDYQDPDQTETEEIDLDFDIEIDN